jgi:hypothetical protein
MVQLRAKRLLAFILAPSLVLTPLLNAVAAPQVEASAVITRVGPTAGPAAIPSLPVSVELGGTLSLPQGVSVPGLNAGVAASPSAAAFMPATAGIVAGARAEAPALAADAHIPLAAALAVAPVAPATSAAAPTAAVTRGETAPTTLFGRLTQAIKDSLPSFGARFDGAALARYSISPASTEAALREGVRLDKKPRAPKEGAVRVSKFHFSAEPSSADEGPVALEADPKDAASIERALRKLVDSDPKRYGASSDDMGKVHVQFVPGAKGTDQADTYYALFRQLKTGADLDGSPYHLLVDGGSLTFVVKVLDGKPVVMAAEGRLYPDVSADIMTPAFDDVKLARLAQDRLHKPVKTSISKMRRELSRVWSFIVRKVKAASEKAPQLLTREITNVEGTWRAVNIYQASDLKGRPVIVAVDVRSGEAFAWSAQELLRQAPAGTDGISGVVTARGTTLSATNGDHGPEDAMPLPYANVYDEQGRVVAVTAEDGSFAVPADSRGARTLTVKLEGRYAKLSDDDKKNPPIQAVIKAVPGQVANAVLNTGADDDTERAADVNGYVYYSKQVAWLKGPGGVSDGRVESQLAGGVRANRTDMPGNAYYSPADDSLNLQAEAELTGKGKDGKKKTIHFENTAQPSIIYHESTHRAVQILSQLALSAEQAASKAFRFVARIVEPVMDGGVNEAIADTVSMFMRGSPLIGEGFMIDGPAGSPEFIRTGENDTVFDPKDPDPHAQGEAFMGFTWMVRQGLSRALGAAAGAAYANLLIVPTTLYSQPQDVPTAMMHVLLGDMTSAGAIPHEALIRHAARQHGLDLPAGLGK